LQVNGNIKVKRPIEVNFKQGGGQKNFYPLLSHFQNDGALELKKGRRKGVGKG